MSDETRDHPDAASPGAPAPAESAPPGEDGPVAVPDPERARILADYDTARERDRAARAAAAAAEPDAKCAALDALTDTLTRRAETDPERIEADPEHPPASDPAPKLPEHLAAAAARVTEVGPRKVADPEAARRLAALDEPARSEPPARAAETAPAPAQNGKRPRGKERRKATEPAKRRRKRAADDARAQRRAELTADLERAADTPALLVAMARLTWADSHDGAECPADRIPGAADLAGWLPACPEDVWEALAVAERDAGGGVAWLSSTGPALAGVGIEGAHGAAVLIGHMAAAVHQHWRSLSAPRPPHPLALLVDAWQRLAPVEVEAETRADRRIMPVLQVVGSSPERERGMLFGGLVDDRPRVADLPLFPELEPTRYRVPLLEIVDATGVPLRSRGRGAPIEARLIVRGGLMMIRPEDRGRTTVRIAVTVGELLDGLYPTKRRIAQNWPKIEAALLTARDFTVPDATGGRWFPMALRRLPAERLDGAPPALDDLVVVDLAPPPGATTGPSVDLPALDLMGVSSGPDWYAYIAARSLIWRLGKTRRPVPQRPGWYGWSTDPGDYPVLTLADLRRFAFGARDSKHRTRASILKPWSHLPDVVMVPNQTDTRTGISGYRLLPAEAKKALRSATTGECTTGENSDVTGECTTGESECTTGEKVHNRGV